MTARPLALAIVLLASQSLVAQDVYLERDAMKPPRKKFSPYANRGFPTNVYFGDTHLHTSLSMDAGLFGNRLGLEEAYRFVRGEEVTSSGGLRARLGRPGLRKVLAAYEETTGGRVLAIPHNGNLSNGLMFDVETLSGGPITRDYALRRQRWEPLYETTQIKGDGEAHPSLSPDDEFADYETWDLGTWI